ncbi:hypothetical protein [Kitasatospora purpeofusca]|uniref:hypothetical protein n=1 Tax=Kitasatospora purpeofusca TaxID=67352 RepID=UPI0037F4EECB
MADTETFGTTTGVVATIALLEVRLPEVRARRRQLEDELSAVVAQENAMVSVLQGLEALADTLTAHQAAGAAPSEAEELRSEPNAAPATVEDVPVAEGPEPQAVPTDTTVPRTGRRRAGAAPGRKTAVKKTATRKATARKTAAAGTPVTGTPDQEAAEALAPTPKTAVRGTAKEATADRNATAKGATVDTSATAKEATTKSKATAEKTAPRKTVTTKTAAKKAVVKSAVAAVPSVQPQSDSVPTAAARKRRTDAKSVLAVLTGTSESLRARQVAEALGLDGADSDVNAVRTMLERLAKNGTARRTGRGLYAAVSG